MTKQEYDKQVVLIKQEYGEPVYDGQGAPMNESATKLKQLASAYGVAQAKLLRAQKIIKTSKELSREMKVKALPLPEEIINEAWLITFTEEQKKIIYQWMTNTQQSNRAIADACEVDIRKVRALKSLEAFKEMEAKITQEFKRYGTLAAMQTLFELMIQRSVPNISFQSAKAWLIDAGVIKERNSESTGASVELTLSPELQEKLRQEGDKLI